MVFKFIIFGITAAVSIWAVVILGEYFISGMRKGFFPIIWEKKRFSFIILLGIACMTVFFCLSDNSTWVLFLDHLQSQIVWNSVFLIAAVDLKTKKIPNAFILFLLSVRLVFIIIEIIRVPSQWWSVLAMSLIGLLAGALFMGTCFLISHGEVGGGDLKLYSSLGFVYGLYGVIAIMLYSLLMAVVVGIGLLVSRKAKFKTTIPMAPFVSFGLTVYLLVL